MVDVRRCPKCQSENMFRSRRRSLEYLLPFFRPYRCYSCERRFLMFTRDTSGSRRLSMDGTEVSGKRTS